ncbi:hypothetical protein B7486_17820 [cyanobacterium TDX16]|nr:hypothetical protein B7486_17820 [cyanobacterium TDX16]
MAFQGSGRGFSQSLAGPLPGQIHRQSVGPTGSGPITGRMIREFAVLQSGAGRTDEYTWVGF